MGETFSHKQRYYRHINANGDIEPCAFVHYSDSNIRAMPLHIGKYINIPFCLVWGVIGVLWVWKVYPFLKEKLKLPQKTGAKTAVKLFVVFMVATQLLTGAALLRMHERQNQTEAGTYAEYMPDQCFTDQRLQSVFPKMKSTVTGEKIYALRL